MPPEPIRILVIEDDPDYVEIVRLCLDEPESMELRFELESATRLAEGLQKLAAGDYDAVIVDLGLPDARGLEAALAVLNAAPDVPVLVSTNMGDEAAALEAMRLGAQDFMVKASSDSRMLKRSIRYAMERKAALAERDALLRAAPEGIVVVDEDGVVRFANRAAERTLGARAEELLGKPFPIRLAPGRCVLDGKGGCGPVEARAVAATWNGRPAILACLREERTHVHA